MIIRKYDPKDSRQIVAVYRDSYDGLRASRGGKHPDSVVDKVLSQSDQQILRYLTKNAQIVVAEMDGEIAGMGAIKINWLHRILGSAYSTGHYVKKKFQKGKSGVNVGSALRKATIEKASQLGCRKIYGYSTMEAVNFHRKFGAEFYPKYDNYLKYPDAMAHYYEIILRPSFWNGIRIEPYVSDRSFLGKLLFKV